MPTQKQPSSTSAVSADVAARICVGEIVAPHGVRGAVKVRTFTEDAENLTAYGALTTQHDQALDLTIVGVLKDAVICAVKNISTRNDAENLRGTKLFIDRDQLPELEDGVYHADLVGFRVNATTGEMIGIVEAIENYGSADLLDVKTVAGKNVFIPYTGDVVFCIDQKSRLLTIEKIPGLLEPVGDEEKAGADGN